MRNLYLFLLFLCFYNILLAQDPTPTYGVYMLKDSRWPTKKGKVTINVSWDNFDLIDEKQRNWVKEAVENSWEKYSNVDFVGWTKAESFTKGIRIHVDDYSHPHVKNLGVALDGKQSGMVLNFNFLGKFKCYNFSNEDCIKFIAVHEFGHALGFAHEQNRKDCLCNELPQGGDGDFYVTPCDLSSVMNYCNPKWSNHGILSDLDISGLQIIYGNPNVNRKDIHLEKLHLVSTTGNIIDRVASIKSIVEASTILQVNNLTIDPKPVPANALKSLPNEITIRYFSKDDIEKAILLRKLLASEGYSDNSISIEDMEQRVGTITGYVEIWSKEIINAGSIELDEVRLISANNTSVLNIKSELLNIDSVKVKIITEETNPIPQKAIDNLSNQVTIRFFHPSDEEKAGTLKQIVAKLGYSVESIAIENMLPKMSKTYPNYIEIWTK